MTSGEQLVYEAMIERHGRLYADRWLRDKGIAKNATIRNTPLSDTHTSRQHTRQHTRDAFRERTSQRLERYAKRDPLSGLDAIERAKELVAPDREALGLAYWLVVALVATALEGNHYPEDDDRCNNYHCATTFEGLGWMAARAKGRPKPYSAKTIQRWLHRDAPHAATLRRYIAWRAWMTDTLKDFETQQSVGPVIGCHVIRVYTRPLQQGVVSVVGAWMRRQWRNLEQDIRLGRTAAQRAKQCATAGTQQNVHIYGKTKDQANANNVFLTDFSHTHAAQKSHPIMEHYVYPDISIPSGMTLLRDDVQRAARWLCGKLEDMPLTAWDNCRKRYLHAVWCAVKHDLVNHDSSGRRLLMLAARLAEEIDAEPNNTLQDKAAYVWSVIEKRGFAELRRDVPPRLMSKSMFEQMLNPVASVGGKQVAVL